MIEIVFSFAYVGSYYRLKALLSGKQEPMPQYFVAIKWILMGFLFLFCTVTMIFQIMFGTIIFAGNQVSQKTKAETFLNIQTVGNLSCFTVLCIANCIYLGTNVRMWITMKNYPYLRKNECLMVTKLLFNFSFMITQFLGVFSTLSSQQSYIKKSPNLAGDV